MTDSIEFAQRPATRGHPRRAAALRGRLASVLVGIVTAATLALVGYQLRAAHRLLQVAAFFSATSARGTFWVFGSIVVALGVACLLVPTRRVHLVPVITWGGAAVMLVIVGIGSREAWSAAMAAAILLTAWYLGDLVLRRSPLRRSELRGRPAVAFGLGYTLLATVLLLIGLAGWFRWWTVGVPVLVGAVMAVIRARPRISVLDPLEVRSSPLGAFSMSVLGLIAAFGSVWAAAPEIQYDAVYGHTWLSALWAHQGRVSFTFVHPVVNMFGNGYLVPVPAHLLGAPDVGRWLEYWMALCLVFIVFRLCREHGLEFAAVAAVVLVSTPHLLWQMSTADDDLALCLLVLALGVAVTTVGTSSTNLAVPIVVGFLAGGALAGKLHLAAFAAGAAGAWLLLAVRDRRTRSLVLLVAGAFVAIGPPLIARWAATGNPLFPQFNNVFRSPHYAAVNEHFNLPFLAVGGMAHLVRLPFTIASNPTALMEAVPIGVFGLLVVPLFAGAVSPWIVGRRWWPAGFAMVVALGAWWSQLRYLRYLLPYALMGLVLLAPLLGPVLARRGRIKAALTSVGLAAVPVLCFASSLSAFWNIRERFPIRVAVGQESAATYLARSLPVSSVSSAINRVALPGDLVVGDVAYARSLVDLSIGTSPNWEFENRLQLAYPTATSQIDEIYDHWIALGAREIAVDAGSLAAGNYGPEVAALVRSRAELAWAGNGFQLYRLAVRPRQPSDLGWCDPTFTGQSGCWNGRFDDAPGLASGESSSGAQRYLPACAGATYEMTVDVGGTTGSAVLVVAVFSGDRLIGYTQSSVPVGGASTVALTAAPGATKVEFGVSVSGGAVAERADGQTAPGSPPCSSGPAT